MASTITTRPNRRAIGDNISNANTIGSAVGNGILTSGGSATSGTSDLYLSKQGGAQTLTVNSAIQDSGLGTAKTRLVVSIFNRSDKKKASSTTSTTAAAATTTTPTIAPVTKNVKLKGFTADSNKTYTANIDTNFGPISFALDVKTAPKARSTPQAVAMNAGSGVGLASNCE